MARRPRGKIEKGTYHVTMRSAGPIPMFRDDTDRTDFSNLVARTIRKHGWVCRSFCLMPTHYHLILDVDEGTLQPGMHAINGQYAQRFNRCHRRSGHLCGSRYGAVPILTVAHMLRAFRYVARNPVEAGLCRSPVDWRWSSYSGCIGLEPGFYFVMNEPMYSYFGSERASAIREIRAFVES
jgi:REP element-mobilizing transposase RayT